MSGKPAPTALTSPRGSGRPFVGRAGELGELRGALEEAHEGRGLLVLLSGEPGIGKTRLMQEAAREAGERGWRVAAGRCWEEGGAPAYWPWIQAVRALGGDVGRFAAAAGGSGDPETVRFRLFDAAGQFLVAVARDRPLMIVLDDLHAADAASLVLLRFVSEAIADAPILILGSYREREVRLHERRESFAELTRTATRISLQGLSVDDVEAYLAGVTGQAASRSLAARLHALTGGNPFFLGEVVRAVARDGLPEGGRRSRRRAPRPR
jgi:predicted ATPase